MTNQSIAEIMGWEFVAAEHPDVWPGRWLHPNGVDTTTLPPKPTPDDMLAWLVRDQVTAVAVSFWGRPGSESRAFVEVKRGGASAQTHAPTLHAALAAAVRAIASEQS